MPTVISVEQLSKSYRLGQIGTGTLTHDLNVWWARVRGKPNPRLRIGESDDGSQDGETIWALKDVSFTVGQGEVLGIIGRNGAGKSTLLKILSRVTAPTSGRVKVRGRIASLLEVGTGFHPDMTGRENIYLNGAILGMTRGEITRKFDEIVDFAEVEKFIDTPVKRYSSGMYVRLAFAVAAHLDPEILVVDEVLAVGDAAFQKKCLGKMGDVAKKGRTVLFVSHNMAAVNSLCQKTIILRQGQCSSVLETKEAIDDYINDYSAGSNGAELATLKFTNRSGTGEIRFKRIFFQNSRGDLVKEFVSGETAFFVLEYESSNDTRGLQDVQASIVIYTSDNIRVANLWNVYKTGEGFRNLPRTGSLVCKFEKLPFRSGKYYIDVWCGNTNQTFDWLQSVASFHVTDGDYYRSGRIPHSAVGILFLEHDWSFTEIASDASKRPF